MHFLGRLSSRNWNCSFTAIWRSWPSVLQSPWSQRASRRPVRRQPSTYPPGPPGAGVSGHTPASSERRSYALACERGLGGAGAGWRDRRSQSAGLPRLRHQPAAHSHLRDSHLERALGGPAPAAAARPANAGARRDIPFKGSISFWGSWWSEE